MKLSRYIYLAAASIIIPALTSCRKELCENHFPLAAIALSWEQEWERDYGMAHAANWDESLHGFAYGSIKPGIPEWVTLISYNPQGVPSESYLAPEGGEIYINESGNHSFLLYNGDTEYIVLSDMASSTEARASTTSRSRSTLSELMSMYPSMRSTNPPDILYAAFIEKITDVKSHSTTNFHIKMQPLVYTYVIRYEFEHGLEHVALSRGALGGMAESVFLRDGSTSDQSSIILFDCDIKSYGCEAHVRSFGIPGFPDEYFGRGSTKAAERPYTLNLEVRLKNGNIVSFDYDIADQIAKQPRGGVIRISGIRIEDEQNMSDSGFDVNINDWDDYKDIDLPVGVN